VIETTPDSATTTWPRALDLGRGDPGGRGVRFDLPVVLAPMEGVTHRVFRDLILDLGRAPGDERPGGPGAAWTEFLRVSQVALRPAAVRRELGPPRADVPVGVQLMGTDPGLVAESARAAAEAGAPMVDLNFGCPAPVVFNKCAGSALLDHPERIEALVGAAARAAPVPVTAKVRLGTTDDSRLEEVVRAVEAGGAALLTVHARTRQDGYAHPARWEALARVRAWTRLPLLGNGDVLAWEDAARMVEMTGVDGVMIGRGALRDPWVFARIRARVDGRPAPAPGPADVLALHARYRDDMLRGGATERGVLGQLKQLYRRLAVGLPLDDAARTALLRAPTLAALEALLEALAALSPAGAG
jgi:tRNA-dihydrouridine synthase C